MIELQTLNGEEIELKNNEFTIELNNSLFNDGAQLKGSFSYPISLALSRRNISELFANPNTSNNIKIEIYCLGAVL